MRASIIPPSLCSLNNVMRSNKKKIKYWLASLKTTAHPSTEGCRNSVGKAACKCVIKDWVTRQMCKRVGKSTSWHFLTSACLILQSHEHCFPICHEHMSSMQTNTPGCNSALFSPNWRAALYLTTCLKPQPPPGAPTSQQGWDSPCRSAAGEGAQNHPGLSSFYTNILKWNSGPVLQVKEWQDRS